MIRLLSRIFFLPQLGNSQVLIRIPASDKAPLAIYSQWP